MIGSRMDLGSRSGAQRALARARGGADEHAGGAAALAQRNGQAKYLGIVKIAHGLCRIWLGPRQSSAVMIRHPSALPLGSIHAEATDTSPPAPRASSADRAKYKKERGTRKQIRLEAGTTPAFFAPVLALSDRQKWFMSAAPTIGPACPCCNSTAQRSAPGRKIACRSSSTVRGLPLHDPIGMSSRTTLV